MEAVMIDTIVKDSYIKVPRKFRNKRVKVIILDSEEKTEKPRTTKLNFKIDESLEDVIPFADINDSTEFSRNLREKHWQ